MTNTDYPDDALLRRALLANAAFSGLSALVLILAAGPVAGLLGRVSTTLLYVVAGGLALFAVDLGIQSRGDPVNPVRAFGATLGDLAWVGGSAVILALRPEALSGSGLLLIAAVAAVVLALAVAQLAGLRRYASNQRGQTDEPSMYRITVRVPASADVVWERLRALDRIGDFYDLLARVDVETRGDTPVRTCVDRKGRRWSEEVVTLDDASRELTLRFVAEADDFPFPMTSMLGGWEVEPVADGSRITLWYEFRMKGGVAGELSAALLAPALEKRMTPVLEALGREAETTTGSTA